jgi:hypothetical protein
VSSMFRDNESPRRRHLLVFDTSALLSANEKDRVQVWRNNEQLGECYVPGATYAEISQLATNSRKPKEQTKAKEFLKFVKDGCRYKIQPVEDNRKIPIDNQKDRQIIACAHRLSGENPDAVVVLVTYELTLQGLVQQSGLPNFCTVTAAKLAVWFHEDYKRDRVPQEIFDTYRRMQSQRGSRGGLPGGYPSRDASEGRRIPGGNDRRNEPRRPPRQIEQVPEQPILKPAREQLPSPPRDYNPPGSNQGSSSNTPNILNNPIAIAVVAAIATAFCIFLFTKREPTPSSSPNSQVPGIVSDKAVANPEPFRETPSALITEAETAVLGFQRTKDPSVLKEPLNLLQELRNKQGGKLDEAGEQSLSRLKHKYAIEVLATSGQLAEAANLLRQIPQTYSDIGSVREWLVKQNR